VNEVLRRPLETELTPLIGVEDLWLSPNGKSNFQGLQAEFHVKAVGKFPAEYMPGEQIHNGHQVEESPSAMGI